MTYSPVDACRSCGRAALLPVLDMGRQPLANAYRSPQDTTPEPQYPLRLTRCRHCALVQLAGTVAPETLFDTYPYYSSYSTTMVEAMAELAARVTDEQRLGPGSLVIDIGANDGYLLTHYLRLGVPVLGVEPARNLAAAAVEAGVPTMTAYFGSVTARRIRATHGPASVVHANNVMAHAPDINDFTSGLSVLLGDQGVAYVESPYLGRLIDGTEFDTVYHEHVFYYSLTAFDALLRRHGLTVTAVEQLKVHGGSLRYTIRPSTYAPLPEVAVLLAEENEGGMGTTAYYTAFAERAQRLRRVIPDRLRALKADGARIAAYGAAAKGTVLLNYLGVGTELVDAVIDLNPHKQNRLMPGVHIPITDTSYLVERRPSHLLLLAWNLADEILDQQTPYRAAGGRFVIPLPEWRVVES